MKTEWDLQNLYYASLDDPQILRDVEAYEKWQDEFAKKYTLDKSYLEDPKALKEALEAGEEFMKTAPHKPLAYLAYLRELDANNTKAQALDAKLSERYTKASVQTLFFDIELGNISKDKQEEFLRAPELEHYRYFLKQHFENAQFTLSEKEEKILSLKSEVASSRWADMTSSIEAKKMVEVEGKETPLPEALERLGSLDTDSRREAWSNIVSELKNMGEMAAHELNALVTNHKINNELRGYKTPEEATIRSYENRPEVVDQLAQKVTEAFSLSQRFYKAKAKHLNLSMEYVDRLAPFGEFSTTFSFEESVKIIKETFGAVNPLYADIFQTFLDNGHIDVFPKKGKRGGAFCAHGTAEPTLLFLNHVDKIRSFETLAHELGHAIHSERSKEQSPYYEGYSTAVAETASTFFEQVARDALIKILPEEDQFLLRANAIEGSISTIFRQIAAFNFERDLHAKVREEGFVEDKEIAKLLADNLRAHLGDAVKVTDEDGYSYVYWSHFRRFFYVYSYAYGELISKALFARYKEDNSYGEQIDRFLTRGGSMPAEDIFEDIGLSFENGTVFEEGLEALEKEIEAFEKEVK